MLALQRCAKWTDVTDSHHSLNDGKMILKNLSSSFDILSVTGTEQVLILGLSRRGTNGINCPLEHLTESVPGIVTVKCLAHLGHTSHFFKLK